MLDNHLAYSAEVEAAEERFFHIQDRTAANFGYGATAEGLHIAERNLERLAEAVEQRISERVIPSRGWDEGVHQTLKAVSPHVMALTAINLGLTAAMDEKPLTWLNITLGRHLNHEVFAVDLHDYDHKLKAKVEEWVRKKHGNLRVRLQSARSIAKKSGFSFVREWKQDQLTAVGHFVSDIMFGTLTDLFSKELVGDAWMVRVTEQAHQLASEAVRLHVRMNPIFLPSVAPPEPWTDFNKGGPVDPVAQKLGSLMRTRHRETIAAVRGAIKSGQLQPALNALNAVQATPWRINTFIQGVIKECRTRGVVVDGVPAVEDIPLPEKSDEEWAACSDDQKKAWRAKKAGIKQANRALQGDRLRFDEDMETAEALSGHPQFYIPHNLDWRGREYPMTNFNFQREDRVRALFLFRDGEPIGEEGIAWLKVHVANCGDFGKVSKKPYDERIKWVDENITAISACTTPFEEAALQFWTKADKPFLFLAACRELTKALSFGTEYVCGLPCSWDGSCSGAQHLCAATRSTDAWKVNLCDREEVHDLYTIVAKRAKGTMEEDQDKLLASTVLNYGGDWRKVFKRNTMTTFYGSKSFGMTQQHMTDLMEPLRLDVLQKKREEHPFGETYGEQHAASRFLAKHARGAIADELPLPMEAMEFLQGLAGVMAHAGKPLEWVTPVGLPWSNRYHKNKTERVNLWMHDTGVKVRYQPLVATGFEKDIDKKRAVNGAAPNFVHACDAAHLLLTVNASRQEGITQFALVHDSFGSLPSHAARFQSIIREQFVLMYQQHDVLAEVIQQAKCDLNDHNSRLSDLEAKLADLRGSFNIKEVLDARYAFA